MKGRGKEQSQLNRIWGKTLLEELSRFGVKHVCIAPGSRSTPLTLEAEANSKLTIHTHFDERGLGFLALGIAKASNEPVAVIVTSGTAVANLLPAVAESGLTGEKLVLLTADRPVELIDCGANQAIQQQGIFSSHVTDAINLPAPSESLPLNWLLSSVDHCMYRQKELGGSIHINCAFPEPLYAEPDNQGFSDYLSTVDNWQSETCPYISRLNESIPNTEYLPGLEQKKGALVVGNVSLEEAEKAKALADVLGWPLFCDPQSGISSDWKYFDLWLQNESARNQLAECDYILQVGTRLVSKRLDAFIRQQVSVQGAGYTLITDSQKRLNPNHLPMNVIQTDVSLWLSAQTERCALIESLHSGWADALVRYPQQMTQILAKNSELSEIQLAHRLNQIVGTENLFIGNSLIVRLLDMTGALQGKQVFTNRGASGIDGLIATSMGVQKASNKPLVVLLGDTSLLYDLNSLALTDACSEPVVIIVTNNDGGAIFDLLPVPEQQKQSLYQMPHGYDFEFAAKQFRLGYINPGSVKEMESALAEHIKNGKGALLVELKTPPEQATKDIKSLVAKVHALQ
ncbi:2-succinyl-5-enolpyruvyl-6-hydroxy-3-cyclohexene-1-carboxylic-acid synthase [Vibrio sp. JC009]|uniref:2-succinyl-5-enolpyruvyl-6-hydroxy-3- cyclohexene-1-carboxylic-acid synthase n=1 Tax=Vibrio sp. JC009 TaxID=2912314 RepID=UPI0023B0A01B|nr:2-succinyl-5-enolpyruvyl-6-hydroxy-3-cyclohexene-1-carboxylic-acid synthase [Vibrio sp. JC009]WED22609.1 2-succinyl-5-enolpyruvyl-6-hydroxy-3-cyclohexene-1-carboxylic-acid synthase [Vibrio sp. JC009]